MNDQEPVVGDQMVAPSVSKRKRRKGDRLKLPPQIDPELAAVILFTKSQMASMLQVSVRMLDYLMQRREVSYLKLSGKIVRFRVEDVLRRLNEVALVTGPEVGTGTQKEGSTVTGNKAKGAL